MLSSGDSSEILVILKAGECSWLQQETRLFWVDVLSRMSIKVFHGVFGGGTWNSFFHRNIKCEKIKELRKFPLFIEEMKTNVGFKEAIGGPHGSLDSLKYLIFLLTRVPTCNPT